MCIPLPASQSVSLSVSVSVRMRFGRYDIKQQPTGSRMRPRNRSQSATQTTPVGRDRARSKELHGADSMANYDRLAGANDAAGSLRRVCRRLCCLRCWASRSIFCVKPLSQQHQTGESLGVGQIEFRCSKLPNVLHAIWRNSSKHNSNRSRQY